MSLSTCATLSAIERSHHTSRKRGVASCYYIKPNKTDSEWQMPNFFLLHVDFSFEFMCAHLCTSVCVSMCVCLVCVCVCVCVCVWCDVEKEPRDMGVSFRRQSGWGKGMEYWGEEGRGGPAGWGRRAGDTGDTECGRGRIESSAEWHV